MYIFVILIAPIGRTKKPTWISASPKVSFRVSVRSKHFHNCTKVLYVFYTQLPKKITKIFLFSEDISTRN